MKVGFCRIEVFYVDARVMMRSRFLQTRSIDNPSLLRHSKRTGQGE